MQKNFRLIISMTLICYLLSCTDNGQTATRSSKSEYDSITIQSGKEWLKKNIESFFNNENNFMKGLSYLCTKQYTEFKTDAINIDLDGGMTEPEFKSKWGRRYSQYAGIGEGFMIAGTDFGKIEVAKCQFRNMTEMKNFVYDVLIIDKTFNSKFIRQVVLVRNRSSFLIDDVLEISNKFEDKK